MTAAPTPKPSPTLAALRSVLLRSTSLDALAIGAGMVSLARHPEVVSSAAPAKAA